MRARMSSAVISGCVAAALVDAPGSTPSAVASPPAAPPRRDSPAERARTRRRLMRCRLALAEASYRAVIERRPSDPGARAGLGEVLLLQGRPLEALAEVAAALPPVVDADAEDARPWRVRALALVELRRYDLAVAS